MLIGETADETVLGLEQLQHLLTAHTVKEVSHLILVTDEYLPLVADISKTTVISHVLHFKTKCITRSFCTLEGKKGLKVQIKSNLTGNTISTNAVLVCQ